MLFCYAAIGMGTVCFACASRVTVRLEPEERATLRVGQVAFVQLSARHDVIGAAGTALVLLKKTHRRDATIYLYRAVETGNQVLIVTPKDIPEGHCISCVTEHYFITVVR